MDLTKELLAGASFRAKGKWYAAQQVDAFLEELSVRLEEDSREREELAEDARALRRENARLREELAAAKAAPPAEALPPEDPRLPVCRDLERERDSLLQDIKALRQALEPYVDVGGIDWLRFPGGSTNTVSHRYGGRGIMKTLKAQAEQKGYHWIDWNVCAEDATASHPDAAQILRNIRRDAEGHDLCVVLLHDTKATGQTVKALPDIIQWFREEGYTFCTVAQMQAVKDEVSQPKEQPAG